MSQIDFAATTTGLKRVSLKAMKLTAFLSWGALVIWALGIPGVQNEYARGWNLGLQTLFHYAIGCGILLILYWVSGKMAGKFQALLKLSWIMISLFWLFSLYSMFKLYQAFQIMGAQS